MESSKDQFCPCRIYDNVNVCEYNRVIGNCWKCHKPIMLAPIMSGAVACSCKEYPPIASGQVCCKESQ